ncbi:MAG: hypothetical protein PWR27_354 [Petroclostridium sp.]|jgi:hypothetical protein|uniref:hypothetical protein n=1 Tax=Petroclostridium xylanilyticum TaxID=1792311 RepID=UPI000B98EC56|nr:hypothetical protein [Petroclostridium xylanilyticum]MBZ4646394.1 hypothetical protein [Clostridia bacterium]MDK2809645.1 hypothetical protein [Petroclostridium sp.]
MIKIIMDKEGTGKTKRLIDMANRSATEDSGNIIYIDDNNHHMYDLNHEIRFVDTSEFDIDDLRVFYGFICGIISENFDISQIYIDDIYKIVKDNSDLLEIFLQNIRKISEKFSISFTMTLNGDPENAPAFLKEYILR